jgi:hypothetical protein
LEGIIVGKDSIPVLPDILSQLDDFTFDSSLTPPTDPKTGNVIHGSTEQHEQFVQNNKHNQVTSTYYLLLKKKERKTGRNYLFELVTAKKRNNIPSIG